MKVLQGIANGSTKLDEKTKRRGRSIVNGGEGTASRTVGLLGAIFTYAIACEIVEINPCRGIKRFPAAQTPRVGNPFVFPADRSDGFFEGLPKIWRRVRKAADLEYVRVHDLRHSFASVAVAGGASLPIIGALLGHKDTATTQRYAHLSADPLRAVSQAVADAIAQALEGGTSEATGAEVPNDSIIEAASNVHSRVH